MLCFYSNQADLVAETAERLTDNYFAQYYPDNLNLGSEKIVRVTGTFDNSNYCRKKENNSSY